MTAVCVSAGWYAGFAEPGWAKDWMNHCNAGYIGLGMSSIYELIAIRSIQSRKPSAQSMWPANIVSHGVPARVLPR
jgi:hypothetical protein